jgi:diacylglycerol O-acyltransferase
MDDIAAIRERHGGTVNDVALTAVCHGLRELLHARQEHPGRHAVRTLVPVSTRAPGDESIRDNRVSAMLLDLPVHLDDPVDQLHAIRHDLARLRWSGEPAAGAALAQASTHVPYEILAPMLRMAFRLPQHQLTTVTTNVPGPSFPLYAFGSRMVEAYPYVPVADGLRLGIAMFSYCGEMTFGITSDAAQVPDADVLATGIENGFALLRGEPAKVSLVVI